MKLNEIKYLLLIIIAFVPELVFSWGSTGHKIINRRAVRSLPECMSFFKADSLFYESHASDADNRRNYNDTSLFAEQWRHYFDIDDYPNFNNLPRDLNVLISLYGLNRVKNNGTNPWAVVWFLDSLTAQFARNDMEKLKQTASDLGHYIGDGFQPLHCTANYNGQLTGNDGIHSRYESTMLNSYQSQIVTQVSDIAYINSPIDYIFDYILYSNSLVDSILQADNYAKTVSGWNGSGSAPTSYYTALWGKTKNLTIESFQRATTVLASFWYTAFLNSGKFQIIPSPSQINFTEIPPNTIIIDSVLLTNTTAETLIVNVVNPDTQNFLVTPSNAKIPKGLSQKFYVFFKPSSAGTFSSIINFHHNLHIPPINLSVNGISTQRTFTLDQNRIIFLNTYVGESRLDSLTLYNTSGKKLSIVIINPDTLNFSVLPKSLNIPVDSSAKIFISFQPKIANTFDYQFTIEHNLGTAPINFSVNGNSILFSMELNVNSNWNLISIPLESFDSMVTILFPNSIMDYFYSYSSTGYQKQFLISKGVGYWAKFSQAQSLTITGKPLRVDTIKINAGWNIIGSISQDVTINNIFTEPNDLILSNFYGYNGSYFVAETLKSGLAYWVKAQKGGKIILSASKNVKTNIKIDPTPVNPPSPPGSFEDLDRYILYQNFPNPFNPTTRISYTLGKKAYVQLIIFDVLGREVARLVDGYQDSGSKSVLFDGSSLPSGIYFYKLLVRGEENIVNIKKMTLVK